MTTNKTLTIESVSPSRIATDVFVHPTYEYMLALDDIFNKNPDALDKILNNSHTALLFFMWLSSIGTRYRNSDFTPIKYMDKLWGALVKHGWIDMYADKTIDKCVNKYIGNPINISGQFIRTDLGNFDNFSAYFGRYLYNIYAVLNANNRADFQKRMPVWGAGELFLRNSDAYFSLNEYIPTLEKLNKHLDMCPIIALNAQRMQLSSATYEMLENYKKIKDPRKFSVLWERLAGNPDYGSMMLQLAQFLRTWFDVHKITQSKNFDIQNQK